ANFIFTASFSVTTERGFFVVPTYLSVCTSAYLLTHLHIISCTSAHHHLHFPKHKAQAQNANTNGGDASRVGIENGGKHERY
ncbi:hypothetical protein, partial [Prevotellamassilia timonensis]|uniref:hypothetical protein n=1 Tax=Prevotellamassilia timonensis TaxID=1852370 RepID=UPI0030799C01